jgi:hypothetical protein
MISIEDHAPDFGRHRASVSGTVLSHAAVSSTVVSRSRM